MEANNDTWLAKISEFRDKAWEVRDPRFQTQKISILDFHHGQIMVDPVLLFLCHIKKLIS